MIKLNENYKNLKDSYLFSEIAARTRKYQQENPNSKIIKMGIGDVTRPLCKAVVEAMNKAVNEQGVLETFHGYCNEQGYDFLREAIKNYYTKFGVTLDINEVFVSDGAKSDLGNILDIFGKDAVVMIPNPVYPVYADTNIMDGRKIIYADANEKNGFLPLPTDGLVADLIYLCSPNNPTGATYTREQLKKWVDYANEKQSIILFDAAYESFVTSEDCPRSIYEIKGAEKCAIEFCSLSKTAGFTGTRCGYTIVPFALTSTDGFVINKMWLRRQTTKFNGVSYVVQRGAEAVFTDEGQKQIKENIVYYQENAKIIMKALDECNIRYFGGKNSPYIWLECPNNMESFEFFDYLLANANVVGTPGSGFGSNGTHFFRLTSFSTHENTKEAMERLKKLFK